MKLLVDETRKYALFKNAPDPIITYEEIKCAVEILILSGYDVKPARRYYWDSKSDMGTQLSKNLGLMLPYGNTRVSNSRSRHWLKCSNSIWDI
ncbi:hypothetical protein NQ318_000576 [Aromia moschata]|uniref:Uncharacterized protein n=1 Tax=Aromia moschata TaxID=1265417 RepID=A0AAV8XB20_9CUCU|nr:hypothetical protein NQ318_000576 [Aromia moschata]